MNALVRLDVLNNKPQRIDGYHLYHVDDFGWQVRFGYRIKVVGVPNSRYFALNDPSADGIPHEVEIVSATLIGPGGKNEQELNLNMFSLDRLVDVQDEISADLDEDQL